MAIGTISTADVRIVVLGDPDTGKSTLIASVMSEIPPKNIQKVLQPTLIPEDFYPDRVPLTIIDTDCCLEDRSKLAEVMRDADAIILTYSCDQPQSFSRLSTMWLQELRQLQVKTPIIVVGCKLDLKEDAEQVSMEQIITPVMQQYREIETCLECSALSQIQVHEVFYYAQKAVLHPTGPLYDHETHSLKPKCARALKRIFNVCDYDMDGALNDGELNEFQVRCFSSPMQPTEITGVKRVVQENIPGGVNQHGITLSGFIHLHTIFIEKGSPETTWMVLRKFGYDNDLKLGNVILPNLVKRSPDQSAELTNEAEEYLRRLFRMYDKDNDGSLQHSELDDMFSTAPESPWDKVPYKDAVERTPLGALSLDGFLSEWALMTLLDPRSSVAYLIYLGYRGDPASAVCVTRSRSVDMRKQQTERKVLHCFVFGPKNAGKSALLDSFLKRPFSGSYTSMSNEHYYATNAVELLGGTKKTLVLREIPEDGIQKILCNKESLAACDIAVFLYDCSNEGSWKRATELLGAIGDHGEITGFKVPCLMVAAKDDLHPFTMSPHDYANMCRGEGSPIPVSAKLRDMNNLFAKFVTAAGHPHFHIPKRESTNSEKKSHNLIQRSLLLVSVTTSVAVVGVVAYKAYAARRGTSNG